jgi:hypothetical protein
MEELLQTTSLRVNSRFRTVNDYNKRYSLFTIFFTIGLLIILFLVLFDFEKVKKTENDEIENDQFLPKIPKQLSFLDFSPDLKDEYASI